MRSSRLGALALVLGFGLALASCEKDGAPSTAVGPTDEGGTLAVDATASATSGRAPLSVNFSANPRGGKAPYTFSWSFGDGSGSSAQNPTKVYGEGGSHRATVTVTSGDQQATSSPLTINVDSDLRLACFIGPTDGVAAFNVRYRAQASGGNGDYTYRWTFGDGGSATGSEPDHTYETPGTFTVSVTVSSGGSSASCRDTVRVYETLLASCRANVTRGSAPLSVNLSAFTNFCRDPGCAYEWDFGDGTTTAGIGENRATHVFSRVGTFEIVARVQTGTDKDTCRLSVTTR